MRLLVLAALIACGPKPSTTTTAPPPVATPAVTPPVATDGLAPPQPTVRLPRNFLPTAYDVRLSIDPAKPKFDGVVAIAGKVSERSRVLWLHAYQLEIARGVARNGTTEVALAVKLAGEDLLEITPAQP